MSEYPKVIWEGQVNDMPARIVVTNNSISNIF